MRDNDTGENARSSDDSRFLAATAARERASATNKLILAFRIERASSVVGKIAGSLALLFLLLGLFGLLDKIWIGRSLLR